MSRIFNVISITGTCDDMSVEILRSFKDEDKAVRYYTQLINDIKEDNAWNNDFSSIRDFGTEVYFMDTFDTGHFRYIGLKTNNIDKYGCN